MIALEMQIYMLSNHCGSLTRAISSDSSCCKVERACGKAASMISLKDRLNQAYMERRTRTGVERLQYNS